MRFAIFTTINVVATSLLTNFVSFPFIDELATHIACVVKTDIGGSTIYLQAGLLARVFLAGVANGVGSSLSFTCGGSAGGVDTLSYYFSLRKSSNIGRYAIAINSVIFFFFLIFLGLPAFFPFSSFIFFCCFAGTKRESICASMGKPSKLLGYFANTVRSRTLANRTMAIRKPIPPVIGISSEQK